MQEMEEKGILSMEGIGWHDKEIMSPWKTSTAMTKRKLMVLMNCMAKLGCDRNKNINKVLRELHTTTSKVMIAL